MLYCCIRWCFALLVAACREAVQKGRGTALRDGSPKRPARQHRVPRNADAAVFGFLAVHPLGHLFFWLSTIRSPCFVVCPHAPATCCSHANVSSRSSPSRKARRIGRYSMRPSLPTASFTRGKQRGREKRQVYGLGLYLSPAHSHSSSRHVPVLGYYFSERAPDPHDQLVVFARWYSVHTEIRSAKENGIDIVSDARFHETT